MVKDITTDTSLLSLKCKLCDTSDSEELLQIIADLTDTAEAHKKDCSGLSANQVGHYVQAFVLFYNERLVPIVNAEVLMRGGGIKALPESCLSRPGKKAIRVRRFKQIRIKYYDPYSESYKAETFKGWEARVVQHEMDHAKGILI